MKALNQVISKIHQLINLKLYIKKAKITDYSKIREIETELKLNFTSEIFSNSIKKSNVITINNRNTILGFAILHTYLGM